MVRGEQHEGDSEQQQQKQQQSAQDAVRKKCDVCGKSFRELNYCVHCAISVCAGCRSTHCEDLIEEYEDARQQAFTLRKKVNKKIVEIQSNLDDIVRTHNDSESKILKVFEEIEEELRLRRRDLLGDLRRKKAQQSLPLQNDKKALEKELGSVQRKFENNCNVSVSALRSGLNSGGKIVDDSKFAHLCACNYKSKECLQQFEQLAEQSDQVNQPNLVRFKYEEQLDKLKGGVNSFAEIEVYPKK